MKKLIYISIFIKLLTVSNSHASFWDFFKDKRQKVNICYFSLNNGDEYDVTEDFVDDINVSKNFDIEVHEFQGLWSNPQKSFQNMIESGVKCDGLVISGHHTSSFGGKRASGQLSIDFMEGLNCNETHYKWFKHVKSLWLQGCRTLGGEIVNDQDAEYHADRVSAVLDEDHLQLTREELTRDFAALLDNENPLSTRYARIFPNATLFGWTATAPGEKWGSEKSLVYHIANIAQIQKEDTPIEDPFNIETDNEKQFFNDTLLAILLRDDNCDPQLKKCFESSEELYIQAWINHGHEENFTYAYMNDELDAYPSLFGKAVYTNKEVKDINLEGITRQFTCSLKGNKPYIEILESVKGILKNPKVLQYTSSLLTKYLTNLQDYEKIELSKLIADSDHYVQILTDNILSPNESLGSKFESYSIYLDIIRAKNFEDKNLTKKFKDSISRKIISVIKKSKSRTRTDLTFIANTLKQAIELNIWSIDDQGDIQLKRNRIVRNHFLTYLDSDEYMSAIEALEYSYKYLPKDHHSEFKTKLLTQIKQKLSNKETYDTASSHLFYYKRSYIFDNIENLIEVIDIKSNTIRGNGRLVRLLIANSNLQSPDEFSRVYKYICENITQMSLSVPVTPLFSKELKIIDIMKMGINSENDSMAYKEMLLATTLAIKDEYGSYGPFKIFLEEENNILPELQQNIEKLTLITKLNLSLVLTPEGQVVRPFDLKKTLLDSDLASRRILLSFVLKNGSVFKEMSRDDFIFMIENIELSSEDIQALYKKNYTRHKSLLKVEYIFSLVQRKNADIEYFGVRFELNLKFFKEVFLQKLITQKNYKILFHVIDQLIKSEYSSIRKSMVLIKKYLYNNSEFKNYVLSDLNNHSIPVSERFLIYRSFTSLSGKIIDNSFIFDIETLISDALKEFDSVILDEAMEDENDLESILKILSSHHIVSDEDF